MKKLFLLVAVASFSLASVAAPFGDDKNKDKKKCDNKAACCKTAKADAGSTEKKCCKGDAAKCSDKKAEGTTKTETTEKK